MRVGSFTHACVECGRIGERMIGVGTPGFDDWLCAECIREAAILLRRAELPKDDVPSPEGERKA